MAVDEPRERCTYDPRELRGLPIGMTHCPLCGCMVIGGMEHGPCDEASCLLGAEEGDQ